MPKLTENNLKKDIKSKNMGNLYFLNGEEKYLISFYRDKIISCVVKDTENSFNFQKFSSDNAEASAIIESVEAFPLMSAKKCVLVEDMDLDCLSDSDFKDLIKLISDVPEYCTLIFSMSTISLKKSSKVKKFISQCEKYGNVIEFEKRGDLALERQLVSWAEKSNLVLSGINASKIIRNCGNDLQTLKNEMEKLCAYVLEGEITEQDIDRIITKNLETTVFVLSNALANGDYAKAYTQLDILMYQKEEPIAILAVLSGVYIDMYRAKVFMANGKDIMKLKDYFDYKGKEFRIKNAVKNSRRLSINMLRDCIDLLLEADLKLKSSKTDKRTILEVLIAKLSMLYKKEISY